MPPHPAHGLAEQVGKEVGHGLLLRKFGLEFLRYDQHTGNVGIEFPDLVQQFLGQGAGVRELESLGIVDGDFHGIILGFCQPLLGTRRRNRQAWPS